MRKAIWTGLLVASVLLSIRQGALAQGGLWDRIAGPRNFDECVLRNLPGATSNSAISAVYASCRNLFSEIPDRQSPQFQIMDVTSHFPEPLRRNAPAEHAGDTFRFQFNNTSDHIEVHSMRVVFEIHGSAASRAVVECHPAYPVRPYQNVWFVCPYRYDVRWGNLTVSVTRVMGRHIR
jgi:hypothetical protein